MDLLCFRMPGTRRKHNDLTVISGKKLHADSQVANHPQRRRLVPLLGRRGRGSFQRELPSRDACRTTVPSGALTSITVACRRRGQRAPAARTATAAGQRTLHLRRKTCSTAKQLGAGSSRRLGQRHRRHLKRHSTEERHQKSTPPRTRNRRGPTTSACSRTRFHEPCSQGKHR
jgi:hypothetical protein